MTGMFQSSSTQSGMLARQAFQRLLAVAGLGDGEAVRFQDAAGDLAHDAAVIDDEANARHRRVSAGFCQRQQPPDIQHHQQAGPPTGRCRC